MRAGNLTDMNGYSLQRIKIIQQLPQITNANNGQIYLYVGESNIDVKLGDIIVVQQGRLVILNRSSLNLNQSDEGSLLMNQE